MSDVDAVHYLEYAATYSTSFTPRIWSIYVHSLYVPGPVQRTAVYVPGHVHQRGQRADSALLNVDRGTGTHRQARHPRSLWKLVLQSGQISSFPTPHTQ